MGSDISTYEEEPEEKISLINKILKLSKTYPYLNVGNRNGYTDYIDYIKLKEVTSPIMWGRDIFNRPFIVIKYYINNITILQTYFQRYIEGCVPVMWMACGHSTRPLIETSGGMNIEQYKFLYEILRGNSPIISEYHRPELEEFINKRATVFPQKEWNASKIIQKNWKIVRYNPKYKMCEKVQLNNQKDIEDECNITIYGD